ncbi:hypothetical protein [Pseudoxanthomonas taiwanensis]|jgi:hypothetical protein|uniref:Uncharacterized protein n=1 Tax=Pseudoxanthomonas taiwanensis TaxID=176598 RepID=A0A921NSU8_9GAMM|nr:hypothetical protein [Pseudoxanthomonas taiwanensis]KAF1688394.1 hypothetical protein CR938_10180 [Pseudoxanthomonas taiwanensis]
MDALVPLIVAITGLPALGVAAWFARGGPGHSPGMALRWALLGAVVLLGALGLYWAGGSRAHVAGVLVAMAIAVNALFASMVLHLRRDRK